MKAKTFEDLIVWQKSHQFVLKIYQMTQNFPRHEVFGLISQIRRSAVSVPANTAEGF
jgi:four helix bundle protein